MPDVAGLAASRPVFATSFDQAHSEDCLVKEDRFGSTNLASALAAARGTGAQQSWRPIPPKIHGMQYGANLPSSLDIGSRGGVAKAEEQKLR